MKKHILIDGTPISRQIDGLTQYILNVVLRLDTSAHHYTLLLRPNQCPPNYLQLLQHTNIHLEEANISPIGPLRDIQFWRYLKTHPHYDLALIPSNQYPLALRIPAVYVIHDLIYEQFPEQLGLLCRLKRFYLRHVVRTGLRRSSHIIAVSSYTKNEIIRCYGPSYPIQVIYEGWEHLINQASAQQSDIHIHFSEYLLYVGSSRAHKNLSRLIDAVQQCAHLLPAHMGLVIVGNTQMFTPQQVQTIRLINAARQVVQLTGWISDADLTSCFQHAKGLIFPSLCEGFGIPILEAYYHQIPLLLSNRSSLPEVAGEAAIYFDPTDVQDIARAIVGFANTLDHTQLIQLQNQRLSMYSWQTTATQISHILSSLCDKK